MDNSFTHPENNLVALAVIIAAIALYSLICVACASTRPFSDEVDYTYSSDTDSESSFNEALTNNYATFSQPRLYKGYITDKRYYPNGTLPPPTYSESFVV